MTIEIPFIMQKADSGDADIEYSARLLRRYLVARDWDEGVDSVVDWKVTENSGGANFQVEISAGGGVVQGDDETRQGNYVGESTAAEFVTLDAKPGSNSRYDLIVARVRDEQAGGPTESDMIFDKVTGVAASSPEVPALPASCLLLAIVGPISSSTASITDSLIHDAQSGTGPDEAADAHRVKGHRVAAGTVAAFDGVESAVPNGWVPRDGRALSRTTYAALWNAMGRPDTGDGSTTFNVRDARGRVDVALDNMGGSDAGRLGAANTLGGTGGSADAIVVEHTHPVDPPNTSVSITDPGHNHIQDPHAHFAEDFFLWVTQYTGGSSGLQSFAGGMELRSPDKTQQSRATNQANTTGITATVNIPSFTSGSTGSSGTGANLQPYVLVNSIVRT